MVDRLSKEERVVALYWKVRCLSSLSEFTQARRYLEEALAEVDARNPMRICLRLQSAFLLHAEKGLEKAILELRDLLDRYADDLKSPDLFWIYVQAKTDLGSCLLSAAHYSEAVKELEEALSLQNQPLSRYYLLYWLGDAFYKLGDLDKARTYFEHALIEAEHAPKVGLFPYYAARLRYELALIAYWQHRFPDATRELEFASAVAIADPELLRVIERLKALVDQARAS